jgi:hypothetical protein
LRFGPVHGRQTALPAELVGRVQRTIAIRALQLRDHVSPVPALFVANFQLLPPL